MTNKPKAVTLCNLEVVVMPNGDILCLGKIIGQFKTFGKYFTLKENKENYNANNTK